MIKQPYIFASMISMAQSSPTVFQCIKAIHSPDKNMLTVQEKVEIMEISRNQNNRETAREFNRRHPNRPIALHPRTISKIQNLFRLTGSVHRKKRTASLQTQNNYICRKAEIIEYFEENPHASTREAARILRIPHTVIWKILKDSKFFAYKMRVHQKLHDGDHIKRKTFCQRLLNIFNRNPNFYKKILWTDEKPFRVSDTFNRQNMR